jgi:hypothetical protein
MQRSSRQIYINNEEREEGQDETSARTGQSKEEEDKMEKHTETRLEEQPSNHYEREIEE